MKVAFVLKLNHDVAFTFLKRSSATDTNIHPNLFHLLDLQGLDCTTKTYVGNGMIA